MYVNYVGSSFLQEILQGIVVHSIQSLQKIVGWSGSMGCSCNIFCFSWYFTLFSVLHMHIWHMVTVQKIVFLYSEKRNKNIWTANSCYYDFFFYTCTSTPCQLANYCTITIIFTGSWSRHKLFQWIVRAPVSPSGYTLTHRPLPRPTTAPSPPTSSTPRSYLVVAAATSPTGPSPASPCRRSCPWQLCTGSGRMQARSAAAGP